MSVRIQLRRDTAANWTATNPTLTQGEPGYETDTGKVKYGDGSTAWNSLAYAPAAAIVDGTIVNADVNASAAIAGTKIAPNFGSQAVTTTGTSTAASFIPTSSTVPTNGLYLSAPSSVAISTSGAQRLVVDASGNVGAGVASPGARLHVLQGATPNIAQLYIGQGGGSSNYYDANNHYFRTGNLNSVITATDSLISLHTSAQERLRITSSGLVGVGTSSASSKIHIKDAHTLSADSQIALIENTTAGQPASLGFKAVTGAGAAGNAGAIYFDAGAAGFIDDNKLQFTANHQTSIVPAMTLDGQGRLAIGTTSPRQALTFGGLTSTSTSTPDCIDLGATFTSTSASTNLKFKLYVDSSGNTYGFTVNGSSHLEYYAGTVSSPGNHVFLTGGSERARIDSSGRLGIGTSSPAAKVDVWPASTDAAFRGNSGVSVQVPAFEFRGYNTDSTNGGLDIRTNLNGTFTDRVRITNDGLVGIGSTAPQHKLQVSGGSLCVNGFSDSANAYISLREGFSPSSVGGVGFRAIEHIDGNADGLGCYGQDGISFYTAATERLRINNAGDILIGKTSNAATVVGAQIEAVGTITSTRPGSTGSTSTLEVYSAGAAAYRFYVGMDGTVNATNTTISAISDQRLKENIRDLDVGLNEILALKPRIFDWKKDKGKNIKNDRGFVAQEFEEVFPELVDEWKDPAPEGEDPYKSVRQDLIPVLVKAIQEQQIKIKTLEAAVKALQQS